MKNTDADQQPTPEQAEIIERLRLMQAEVDAVKTDLVRELSKVRDELITSKTERRVLSRWYEDAKAERDKLQADMAALVEDLKASSNLIRAADKDLDDLKSAKDEMQNKLAETTKDLAYSRLAVDTMSERDKRFTETIAKCGAADGEDIGDFIERTCAERDKLHGELVEVRSALADVSAERDSLRTTLATWEAADTAPFLKVPDVADHVMPPVLDRGEPDPANDERDAKLEFRNVVPTPEMIAYVQWWDVPEGNTSICFKHWTQKPVVWRRAGDNGDERWQYENCPQPLKPHGMTWQQVDEYLASKKTMWTPSLAPTPTAERALLPMCDKCHTCGMTLEMRPGKIACRATLCRSNVSETMMWDYDVNDIAHPYHEPCRSRHPVRHE
jgi:hypothetical protein